MMRRNILILTLRFFFSFFFLDFFFRYDAGAREAWDDTAGDDYALFDTTQDVKTYTELGTPWITSIWDMCMGLAGQVHYTLPMGPDGKPTTLPEAFRNPATGVSGTINLTYTEEWVQKLLADAYRKSPLYWHHSTRHAPSTSTMCRRTNPSFYNSSSKRYGWDAMTLGGVDVDCFCGWWRNATHCQPPPTLCATLLSLAYTADAAAKCALYAAGTFDMRSNVARMLKLTTAWPWPCPALEMSDHWGFLHLPNSTSYVQRLLDYGPSGLRINHTLPPSTMNPTQQHEPPPPPLDCTPSTSPSLVNHFIDDLFPAMQGVRHSAPVSYCMRFIIEVARLGAYTDAGLTLPASNQRRVVASWRKKCDLKLQQITLCETYGVFHIPGESTITPCPFTVVNQYPHIITPACLVIYLDVVYDPCLCNPSKFCSNSNNVIVPPIDLVNNRALCAVPHPRDLVIDRDTGLPPWPYPSSSDNATIPTSLVRHALDTIPHSASFHWRAHTCSSLSASSWNAASSARHRMKSSLARSIVCT